MGRRSLSWRAGYDSGRDGGPAPVWADAFHGWSVGVQTRLHELGLLELDPRERGPWLRGLEAGLEGGPGAAALPAWSAYWRGRAEGRLWRVAESSPTVSAANAAQLVGDHPPPAARRAWCTLLLARLILRGDRPADPEQTLAGIHRRLVAAAPPRRGDGAGWAGWLATGELLARGRVV